HQTGAADRAGCPLCLLASPDQSRLDGFFAKAASRLVSLELGARQPQISLPPAGVFATVPPPEGTLMIGIVLVTHGRLAQEFISAMEHMVGPPTHLGPVCLAPEGDIERRQ